MPLQLSRWTSYQQAAATTRHRATDTATTEGAHCQSRLQFESCVPAGSGCGRLQECQLRKRPLTFRLYSPLSCFPASPGHVFAFHLRLNLSHCRVASCAKNVTRSSPSQARVKLGQELRRCARVQCYTMWTSRCLARSTLTTGPSSSSSSNRMHNLTQTMGLSAGNGSYKHSSSAVGNLPCIGTAGLAL